MRAFSAVMCGLWAAWRSPRLVVVAYLLTFLPALALIFMAHGALAPAWDHSLFAQRVLSGSWFGVWQDFAKSPDNHLGPILGRGLPLALVVTALLQVLASAGYVSVLLGRGEGFLTGVVRHGWRFVRAFLWFAAALAIAGVASLATGRAFFKLAESRADGRWDVVGVGAALLVFGLLYVLLRAAYDLSRAAAVHHREGSTFLGFCRALGPALRHSLAFLLLYGSFFVLTLGVFLAYLALRVPWTVTGAWGVAVLFVLQQLLMALRAFLQVAGVGAAVEAYRALGAQRYCRPWGQPQETATGPEASTETLADVFG